MPRIIALHKAAHEASGNLFFGMKRKEPRSE